MTDVRVPEIDQAREAFERFTRKVKTKRRWYASAWSVIRKKLLDEEQFLPSGDIYALCRYSYFLELAVWYLHDRREPRAAADLRRMMRTNATILYDWTKSRDAETRSAEDGRIFCLAMKCWKILAIMLREKYPDTS